MVPMAWALPDAECQAEPTGQVGMCHRTFPWEPRWHHLFPSLFLGTNVLQMFARISQRLGNTGWRQEQRESPLPTVPSHLVIVIVQVICQKESKVGFTQALLCSLNSACPASRPDPNTPDLGSSSCPGSPLPQDDEIEPSYPSMLQFTWGKHPPGPTEQPGTSRVLGASWHIPVVSHRA